MSLSQFRAVWRLSTVRQSLGLLAVFTAIVVLGWGCTYWLVQREMVKAVDTRLSERMQIAVQMLAEGDGLPEPEDGQTAGFAPTRWPLGFRTTESDGPGPEMRYLALTTPQGTVLLGENTDRQDALRDILTAGRQISLIASLLAAIAASIWMARRGQVRLGQINHGLSQVADGRLSTRIALDGDDDLSLIASRIDATTERLERAIDQMQVQASNIAHDLRTPLARLRASIESSLMELVESDRPVSPDDLGRALEEIDRISGMFDALLRLSQIERGDGRAAFHPVDLSAVVGEVTLGYADLATEADQTLVTEVDDPATVHGDAALLAQLTANLVQNALRYGAAEQTIRVRVQGRSLSVCDQGPGIPEAERTKVFQPLHQGHEARQGPGFGIGLAVVRAIADLHDATLPLSNGANGRGLSVSVSFPS